jgi:hypothetical protein
MLAKGIGLSVSSSLTVPLIIAFCDNTIIGKAVIKNKKAKKRIFVRKVIYIA